MDNVRLAVARLRERLGYPPWLSAIGVGAEEGLPVIVLYLTSDWRPKIPELENAWEGYPIRFREFGSIAPLGALTE
jgi:hypothetical protein